jgi:DNA-binding NarL/FixJ family response regulator
MALVGVACSREEGLAMLGQPAADVLLADLGLPDGSGIEVIRAAQAAWPDCSVMVCTALGDEAHVMRALEAGASGYLLKDIGPAGMLAEIRSLHAGGSPISPIIARQILKRFRNATIVKMPPQREIGLNTPQLSARELEVLQLVTKGFKAEEIAVLMGISRQTVMTYVRRIYGKLKVNSRAEAIYEARQRGILAT